MLRALIKNLEYPRNLNYYGTINNTLYSNMVLNNLDYAYLTFLIHVLGGSSACGMYATYLAKSINCFVAATCSTKNIDVVKSFGVDMIIDYTSQHWTEVGQGNMKYDLIFDCVGAEKDEQTL